MVERFLVELEPDDPGNILILSWISFPLEGGKGGGTWA